jgi:membrane associated rhomboid family serine protease
MSYYNSGNRVQKESPVVFYTIAVNVVVFLAQNFVQQLDITNWGSLHYFKSDQFRPHQLITNMFLHGSWGHLFFNMFALYIFGSVLERFWGSKRFFNFYMICGIGSAILVQLTIPFSAEQYAKSADIIAQAGGYSKEVVNMYLQQYSALGASGAIMGVMAAFAYLFPNTELMIMFIPVPVKAKYVIPVYVLLDLFGGFYRIAGDNIGHFAHLGGALIGFLLVLFWNKNNRKTFY